MARFHPLIAAKGGAAFDLPPIFRRQIRTGISSRLGFSTTGRRGGEEVEVYRGTDCLRAAPGGEWHAGGGCMGFISFEDDSEVLVSPVAHGQSLDRRPY